MARLNAATIAGFAYRAGFRGDALVTAVAIAMAESGGVQFAMGDQSLANSKWGPSVGLWQIRSLNAQRGSGQSRDRNRLGDAAFNARAAFEISNGGRTFQPWTVYKTGKYAQYIGQARAAVAGIKGGDALVSGLARNMPGSPGGQGFGAGASGDLGWGAPEPEVDPRDKAKTLYGYLGWFVDHPEVGPIILSAAKEGWDAARLQGALTRTHWWRHTSESARQWDALLVMDTATAARRLEETMVSIGLQAKQLGIPFSRNQSYALAANANRLGWNPQEISLALAAQARYHPLLATAGGIGGMVQQIQQMGNNYLVPITNKQAWQWARRMAGGLSTMEAVEQNFRLQATLRFPHLTQEIRQGRTPGEVFAPHRNIIAETLEISPGQVNLLNDRQWNPVTAFKDPKSKKVRTMNLAETARFARSKGAWRQTDNAWQSVTEAGDAILQMFGVVAR